jgi:hypothetical protein
LKIKNKNLLQEFLISESRFHRVHVCQLNNKGNRIMKKAIFAALALYLLASVFSSGIIFAQTTAFTVTADNGINGAVKLDPAPPADGKYSAGTVVTVTAVPNAGYAIDSVYYSVRGRGLSMSRSAAQATHFSTGSPMR